MHGWMTDGVLSDASVDMVTLVHCTWHLYIVVHKPTFERMPEHAHGRFISFCIISVYVTFKVLSLCIMEKGKNDNCNLVKIEDFEN